MHYDAVTNKWTPTAHSIWLQRFGGAPHMLAYLKQIGALSEHMQQPTDQDGKLYFTTPEPPKVEMERIPMKSSLIEEAP